MTWNRSMSNAPAWKSAAVGYAYVPGPLSSPSGSVTSSSAGPGSASETTVVRAYPVLLPLAAATVSTFVRKPTGTVALNAPVLSAVVATVADGAATSVGVPATTTRAPGAVVPVTVTVSPSTTVPLAGAVIVTGNAPGGPWSTYRSA